MTIPVQPPQPEVSLPEELRATDPNALEMAVLSISYFIINLRHGRLQKREAELDHALHRHINTAASVDLPRLHDASLSPVGNSEHKQGLKLERNMRHANDIRGKHLSALQAVYGEDIGSPNWALPTQGRRLTGSEKRAMKKAHREAQRWQSKIEHLEQPRQVQMRGESRKAATVRRSIARTRRRSAILNTKRTMLDLRLTDIRERHARNQ